jgi:integrase
MTSDEILEQRIKDSASPTKKIQRRFESLFRQFLKYQREEAKKENGESYRPTTLQTMFAAVRSFFEINDYPLIMRRKDYPKGEANGVRRATREMTLKVLEANRDNPTLTALILTTNDTGLGISDLRLLKCKIILENPNAKLIPLSLLRKKTKTLAKPFLGEESIAALKEYFKFREKGTRNVKPETITNDSPLFRVWQKGTIRPLSREGISTLIANAYRATGEKHVSAHSLRKALQTNLEKGGINPNWIDQILAHKLINSRDAYSLPTDEELQAAYEQAYDQVRIYPAKALKLPITQPTTPTQQTSTPDIQEAHNIQEVKALLLKGYKIEITQDGTTLMSKPLTTSPL